MPLPEGYILRHLDEADLPAAQAVLDAAESHDTGERRRHEHELATEWRDPECHPETDWWVATASDDSVVGVAWVWPETAGEVTADHYVHPDHRGLGLGDALLDAIESRAAELSRAGPGSELRRLLVWCEDSDVVRRAALEARGFAVARQYYEMAIDLRVEPLAARWPEGITAGRSDPASTSTQSMKPTSRRSAITSCSSHAATTIGVCITLTPPAPIRLSGG